MMFMGVEMGIIDYFVNAPIHCFAWERLPSGKCIWHCRKDGKSFDKKAPNIETEKNTLWRDPEKKKEADKIKADLSKNLSRLNIRIA